MTVIKSEYKILCISSLGSIQLTAVFSFTNGRVYLCYIFMFLLWSLGSSIIVAAFLLSSHRSVSTCKSYSVKNYPYRFNCLNWILSKFSACILLLMLIFRIYDVITSINQWIAWMHVRKRVVLPYCLFRYLTAFRVTLCHVLWYPLKYSVVFNGNVFRYRVEQHVHDQEK